MRKLRLSARSVFCFASILMLVLLVALTSVRSLSKLYDAEQDVEVNWMASISQTAKMDALILRMRLETLRLVSSSDDQVKKSSTAMILQARSDIATIVSDYMRLIASEEERRLAEDVAAGIKSYDSRLDEIMSIAQSKPAAESTNFINQNIRPLTNNLQTKINTLSEFNENGAKRAGDAAKDTYTNSLWLLGLLCTVALVLTVLLAFLYTRSILVPLREVSDINQRISEGDLRVDTVVTGRDEMADLMRDSVNMQQTLRETIRHIGDASTQLASAAEEMNAVTEEASRGMQRQNGEVEQAATAVNEMTAAVEEVARNAASASSSAQQSEQSTQIGAARVSEAVNAIHALGDTVSHTSEKIFGLAKQAQGIATVVDVIRGIAEQTNLLALNAAIEAARAGEQGRGFAVVADEVRALAHRTQESTREIEKMIGGIQGGSEDAVGAMQQSRDQANSTLKIANEAGAALDDIARSITEINERNFLIATASEEQAQVARSVDQNLVSIRDLSVQSAAGASQTAAAAHEVSKLALDMNRLVTRFSV